MLTELTRFLTEKQIKKIIQFCFKKSWQHPHFYTEISLGLIRAKVYVKFKQWKLSDKAERRDGKLKTKM